MEPFKSMTEARDFFWLAFIQSGGKFTGPKSCLVQFQGGVRQVTLGNGVTMYGTFVEVK